jgi:hypothetical protein
MSYKSECQEKYLPVGSVPTLFLSRHSAQPFERALAIDEWSSSGDVVSCFVPSHETVTSFFLPVVPFHCRDGAIRFLKLTSLTVIRPDRWQLMVLFETRGLWLSLVIRRRHRVNSETLVFYQHGGLTSPIDTLLEPSVSRTRRPPPRIVPRDGTDSLSEALKLLVLNVWRRNLLLSSRRSV